MKNVKNKFSKIMALGLGTVVANVAQARTTINVTPEAAENIGLGNAGPEELVVSVINWVLGFLAIVAVIIIIYGGFIWMTAAGNEEKTEKARKLLIAALIGLLIILAAWGLATYAINNLLNLTN